MPIDSTVYLSPANKGDVSGTAITASVALFAIANALEAISEGKPPPKKQIEEIRKSARGLSAVFDQLTGYHDEP